MDQMVSLRSQSHNDGIRGSNVTTPIYQSIQSGDTQDLVNLITLKSNMIGLCGERQDSVIGGKRWTSGTGVGYEGCND